MLLRYMITVSQQKRGNSVDVVRYHFSKFPEITGFVSFPDLLPDRSCVFICIDGVRSCDGCSFGFSEMFVLIR